MRTSTTKKPAQINLSSAKLASPKIETLTDTPALEAVDCSIPQFDTEALRAWLADWNALVTSESWIKTEAISAPHPLNNLRHIIGNPQKSAISKIYEGTSPEVVGWGTIKSLPINQPLETGGLAGCSALIIINKERGFHALGHAYPETGLENFEEEIGKVSKAALFESNISILPGSGPYGTGLSICAIYAHVASIDPRLATNIKYLVPENWTPGIKRHIIIHEGETFLPY